MDSRISIADKLAILYRTAIKILRGGGTKNFSKRSTWNVLGGEKCANFSR